MRRGSLKSLLNYKSKSGNLAEGDQKLKISTDKQQWKVDNAKNNSEKIEQVKNRPKDVSSIPVEAEKVIEDNTKKGFFKRLLNTATSYKHKREVTETLTDAAELRLTSTKDYEAFESRNLILEDVLNNLDDSNEDIIGIHGSRGIGKTTLAQEVARRAKKDKLFDKVVFVEVTDTPDIDRIQEEIADKLGLQFITETERAMKLYARLKKGEKILVILDNISESLDLEKVGIPSGADRGRCKLLLTTRDENVLERMDSKATCFKIGPLREEEPSSLFQKIAGDFPEGSGLSNLSKSVVDECRGLPLAIVMVAVAFKNKIPTNQLKEALQQPKGSSQENFPKDLQMAYSAIKLSYDHLNGENLKKTFLLCSLMGYETSILDLLKYAVGLDIFDGIDTMANLRDKVEGWIKKLKDSFLLLDGHTSESFLMPDIIREVALSIVHRDKDAHSLIKKTKEEWHSKDKFKTYKKIFESDKTVCERLDKRSKLEVLFMSAKVGDHIDISENLIKDMSKLKVLELKRVQLFSLRPSLNLLVSLQMLCLDYSEFEDIAIVGELRKLKVLSLRHSNIEQLPREIGQLTQLRLLDLSNCEQLQVIAPNVLSSLSRLEELYLGNCSITWEVEELDFERSKASLKELMDLSHLTTLEIDVKDDTFLPEGFFSLKLERYKILVGNGLFRFGSWSMAGGPGKSTFTERLTPSSLRMLKLTLNSVVSSKELHGVMENVQVLCLDKVEGVKNVVSELDTKGFQHLKHLCVQNNPNLLSIVDSTKSTRPDEFRAFPKLESLVLSYMIDLKNICYGQLTKGSFCNLKFIDVQNCLQLKNIFSLSNARSLQQLQELYVKDCLEMQEILTVEREDNAVNKNEGVDEIEFPQLQVVTLDNLPRLEGFYSNVKVDTPLALFNQKVVFPNLTRLIVGNCENLKYIFPSSLIKSLKKLRYLEIYNCKALEAVVEKGEAETTIESVFPEITILKLEILPQLETFFSGKDTSELPKLEKLKKLEICDCNKVQIFPSKNLSFPEISEEDEPDLLEPPALFLAEKIPNLEELKFGGNSSMSTWPDQFPEKIFPKLKVLEVLSDELENFPLEILQRFSSLKNLKLNGSSYQEMLSRGKEEESTGELAKIRSLKLSNLSEMKYMWEQDPKLDSVLQDLEFLEVQWCENLIKFFPSSASFQNLTVLKVEFCDILSQLMTSSMAGSLDQLREMKISDCEMMTDIVGNEGDIVGGEIVFGNLKSLSLEYLASLACFCSGNYTFSFPSLEDLIVYKCPKMKIFTEGDSKTPKLKKVENYMSNEELRERDLNTTIQHLYKNKVDVQSFEKDYGQSSEILSE